MNKITYTRRLESGAYEYGHITVDSSGKEEKRVYNPRGARPTLDGALRANKMALTGKARLGNSFTAPITWSETHDHEREAISAL